MMTLGVPWRDAMLKSWIDQDFFSRIQDQLSRYESQWTSYFPPKHLIYEAYYQTPFEEVSVVILGQDPYHGYGQAHGLAFSVPEGIKHPPSLRNIFKEIVDDVGWEIPAHGDLHHRAQQGVLLLNSVLSVGENEPASHKHLGRDHLTDETIRVLSHHREWLVFLLWWNFARSKKWLIDWSKHLVLETTHPSPLWARRWFFWCKHFSETNKYLEWRGKKKICWIANQ